MNQRFLSPEIPAFKKIFSNNPDMPKEIADSKKGTREQTAEDSDDEEERVAQELSSVGALLSLEHFSNDAIGRDGTIYGVSANYDRTMGALELGGLLDYRFLQLKNESCEDFNSNRISGTVYAGYTINGSEVADYAAYGGGHLALGKDFQIVEITFGAAYLFTKYDIDLADNHSHLVTYGMIAGIPVGRKLAANFYFTETRNVTDYERELADNRYFTLGTELILAVSESWVFSCGYRTIIGYAYYSSHEGCLGTLKTF